MPQRPKRSTIPLERRKAVNEKEYTQTFPTPDIGDVLLFEFRDSKLPKNEEFEYGVTTPKYGNWPDHKLTYISPSDSQGRQKWYYAADRENQDCYNFTSVIANIGSSKFDAVTRVYVIPRDEYDPEELQMGVMMPDIPEGRFIDEHVLAIRDQLKIGEKELDSLYVVEKRVYIKRCSITTIETDNFFGIGGSKVDNLYYRGEVVDGDTVENHFATPNSDYWGWQDDGSQRDGKQLSENWFMISILNGITDEYDQYVLQYPTTTSVSFPREIISANVYFNESKGESDSTNDGYGQSWGIPFSLGFNATDSTSSSLSITPELAIEFRERNGSNLPATAYIFFMPMPSTEAEILAKLSTLHGSTVSRYTPSDTSSYLLTTTSGSASVRSSVTLAMSQRQSASNYTDQRSRTKSLDKQVSQTTRTIQLNNVIGSLNLNETRDATVASEASMTGSIFSSSGNMADSILNSGSVDVTASVTSTGVENTSVTLNGAFLTRMSAQPYKNDYIKFFAEVVDL